MISSHNQGKKVKKDPLEFKSKNSFSYNEILRLRKVLQKHYGMPMIDKTSSGFSIKAPIGTADSRFLENSIFSLMIKRGQG